jgi:carbon monoxide dehydrogenase subunit G
MKEQLPFHQIQMVSGVKSPFPFTLTVFLEEEAANTRGKLVFDAKVGKTIQLIAQKPLRNLFDSMSQRLAKHFEQ